MFCMRLLKKFLALLGICAVFMMAGCSQPQSKSPDANRLEPSVETKGIVPSIKNETEITQDLAENENFYTLFDYNCYDNYGNYSGSTYSIDELTITRRKTNQDAGTDDVYLTITASSPESKYVGDFHLLYSLYDIGGWYLEHIELESGTLEALSLVSEADAYNIVLDLLGPLGADTSASWIEGHEMTSNGEELIIAGVDFNDGILAVQGSIELYFYFDGITWAHVKTDTYLNYDILADGTYESLGHEGYPGFLVINHENGVPVVRRTSGWGGGIDPFKVKDWYFDCLSRAYTFGGGFDGDIPCEYRFGTDGNIYYYINGVQNKTFYRIADPITDANVLWEILKKSGNAW